MKRFGFLLFLAAILSFQSCEESSTDPNKIGGDTDLDLTQPGSEFGVYISMEGVNSGVFQQIEDSCFITKNDNGIVTLHGKFISNEDALKSIDTLLGTENASEAIKHQVVDALLDRFGATLDTTDKEHITLEFDLKGKVTSEGIQDYIYSGGNTDKPFTVVKYNAKVGDKYTFTMDDGTKITREVTYKSNDDDYELGFMYIKVIKIVETQEDPLMDKITYIANHKFGLVGIQLDMKNGKKALAKIFPWDVLM